MITLIHRHIKLFLRDKVSVFFSLFSVLIIIVLYVLFLSENLMSSMPEFENQAAFVFLWMFAGLIAVTTATTPLGALGKYMEDKVSKKNEDLLITRITRSQFAYSYVFYSFSIGVIFTIFLILFGYIYSYIKFQIILPFSLSLFIVILLSIFMHTLLFYLITSYLNTLSAFSGLSTIVGTLIGFLSGIYIPIGVLPVYLQKVITLFPTTQSTVLLKKLLMTEVIEPMKIYLGQDAFNELVALLGIRLQWNGQIISYSFSSYYLIGFTFVLIVLVIVRNRKPNE